MPGCKSAAECKPNPEPDQAKTFLLPSESENLIEYQFALYKCQDGAFLEDTDDDSIVHGVFQLQCGQNGVFPSEIAWPNCTVENCTTPVIQDGFVSDMVMPIGKYSMSSLKNYSQSDSILLKKFVVLK